MEGDTHMSRDRRPLTDVSAKPGGAHSTSKAAELAAVLEAHRGERHAIVMQDYPDPDAISTAWAHKLIRVVLHNDCVLLVAVGVKVRIPVGALVGELHGSETCRMSDTILVDDVSVNSESCGDQIGL